MHILVIHQAFASLDEPGGTRHFEMARHLVTAGHRVTVVASPVSYITGSRNTAPQSPDSTLNGPRILRAAVYGAHHRSFVHRLLAFLSFMFSSLWLGLGVRDVDLVWGTSPPIFQGITAWLLARLKSARFLFEVRDLWPEFAVAVGVLKSRNLIRLSECLERFLYRQADCLVVNSPGFVPHVSSRGAARVEVVPNGADPAMFETSAAGGTFRARHGLEDRFVAVYAGAHGLSNDLNVLIDAAALLQDTEIHILLVGDGKDKPALIARVAEQGIANVTLLPSVPKRQMPEVLAAADAGIAILKPLDAYKTTYPNKVFDYMAAGKPVLLVIDGVIRQVVEEAKCGLFAEPGDPRAVADGLLALSQDRTRAREMGTNGKRYLEQHFSREQIARNLVAVLDSLITKGA